jgi:hypothetical protein
VSADQVLKIRVSDAIAIRERAKVKAKQQGIKGYVFERIRGDEFSRDLGKWVRKERLIDWLHDWYEEVIMDPDTGVIVHTCPERLREHQGHGSAKGREKK